MNKMIVISEEQIKEIRQQLDRLVERIEDTSLPEDDRSRYFEEWRGYRHSLRTLGLKEIYSDYNVGALNPFISQWFK